MNKYAEIFENNRKWAAERTAEDKNFFRHLAEDQNPDFLFIGCSDSRVPANVIMGLDPGEVFVHRNIANVVANCDLNVSSVIHYAVEVLGVKHVVVCGHYNCGGVKAAIENKDMGILNGWLRNIRDVYRIHRDQLNEIKDLTERYNRLVELNVTEQCINVTKFAAVRKSYEQNGYPTVHGWVYDLKNGLLNDLNIDFDKTLKDIWNFYKLT